MNNILILGSKGMLGGALQKVFPECVAWDREDADVTDYASLKSKITQIKPLPAAIINCVAFNDVDGAEERKEIAHKLNAEVPEKLAEICKELNIPFVHFSTNYVFDGQKGEYAEEDAPLPISIYGQSKYRGEKNVQGVGGKYYIIRTAVLFGEKGKSGLSKKSFVDIMLELSQKSDTIKAVSDEVNSITYVKDLADWVKLLLSNYYEPGIYHVSNSGQASWYDIANEIFSITGKKIDLIPVPSTKFPRKARRPKKSVLLNTKLPKVRTWQEALKEFLLMRR